MVGRGVGGVTGVDGNICFLGWVFIGTGMEAGAAGSGFFGDPPAEHEAIPIVNTKAIKVLSKTRRNKLFPFLFKDLSSFGLQRENKKPTLFCVGRLSSQPGLSAKT